MKKKSVKSVKRKNKFYCELCNYTASQKSHFNKHLSTKKHKRMTGKNVENPVKKVLFICIHAMFVTNNTKTGVGCDIIKKMRHVTRYKPPLKSQLHLQIKSII